MMSLAQIQEVSRRAAERAARDKREPFIVEKEDIIAFKQGQDFPFPFIGDYRPRGYRRTEHLYFCDSSGFGGLEEPALTRDQLIDKLVVGRAYAITEVGQFQCYIQEYEVLHGRQ